MVGAFSSLVHLDLEQTAATAYVKAAEVVLYIADQIRTLLIFSNKSSLRLGSLMRKINRSSCTWYWFITLKS